MTAEAATLPHPGSRLVNSTGEALDLLDYLTHMMAVVADKDGGAREVACTMGDDLLVVRASLHLYNALMTKEHGAQADPRRQ